MIKVTKSAIMKIFQFLKKIKSFVNGIKSSFHNKSVLYSWNCMG